MRYTREPLGHIAWFCETCRCVHDCEVRRIDFHRRTFPLFRKQTGVFGHDLKCHGCGSRQPADEGIAEIATCDPIADPIAEVQGNEDHPMHHRQVDEGDLMLGLATAEQRLELIARAIVFRQFDLEQPPERRFLKSRREVILVIHLAIAASASLLLSISLLLFDGDTYENSWIATPVFAFCLLALVAFVWYASSNPSQSLIASKVDARRCIRPLAKSLAAMHATPQEIRTAIDVCSRNYWLATHIDPVDLLAEVQKRRSTPPRRPASSSAARYADAPEISTAS